MSKADFAWRVVIVLALTSLLFLAWQLSGILMLTFGAVVIAVVMRMAADPLARVFNMEERWAALLVLFLILLVLGVVGYFFGREIVDQFDRLRQRLPEGLDRVSGLLRSGGAEDAGKEVGAFSYRNVISAASTTYSFVVDLILVVLVAAYLAFNPSLYRRGFLALMPAAWRPRVDLALATAGKALRGWLLGQLISMSVVGVLTGLGLWLVGVPLALILGLIAGLLEFVPVIGPFLSAVPGILLALADSPNKALYAALVYFAVQQLEGNLVMPLAQRWAVHLPPALGLFSLVAFGGLFGLPGLLFAAPLTIVLMALIRRLYLERPAV